MTIYVYTYINKNIIISNQIYATTRLILKNNSTHFQKILVWRDAGGRCDHDGLYAARHLASPDVSGSGGVAPAPF